MHVIKRDGRKVKWDEAKIEQALLNAIEGNGARIDIAEIPKIIKHIQKTIFDQKKDDIEVEEVQDIVIQALDSFGYKTLAKAYSAYRNERNKIRETKSDMISVINKIGKETDRDNANVGNNFSAKLLRIASEANKWHILLKILPKHLSKPHEMGDYYIHDLDSYNLTINCLHLPTKRLLEHGFNTGYGTINSPKHIEVAAALVCIMLQSSQNDMFGGQSHPNFDNDMSEYVELTRKTIRKEYEAIGVNKNKIDEYVENATRKKVDQAMQAVVYNLNTMHARAGSQVPFSSVNIGIPFSKDAAIVCESFLRQYEKGLGLGEQPIFPNIIFRVKKGVNRDPSDPYYYLFKTACEVAAERMNPTFMNMDCTFNKKYFDKGILPATMGCRTYLMEDVNGEPGVEGRGNNAPVTINLPRLGILAKGDIDKFFDSFDTMIHLSCEQLLHRFEVLKKLKIKDLPFVGGEKLMKGSEKLTDNDSIEKIMIHGTWGIGFIGLAETLKALTGKHHGESLQSRELGLKIVAHLRQRCDELKNKYKLNFSCYATPAEGLSSKFTASDLKMFDAVPWITDKGFYTNSYHVPVDFPISIAEKLAIEAPYHELCNGGHISYVEFDSYPSGDDIESIVKYAYEKTNINYIGVNFHIRYCLDCAK